MSISQTDCINCYKQYQIDKSFNKNCRAYIEMLGVTDKYKDKCSWIGLVESDLEKMAEGNNCLTFGEVERLYNEIGGSRK